MELATKSSHKEGTKTYQKTSSSGSKSEKAPIDVHVSAIEIGMDWLADIVNKRADLEKETSKSSFDRIAKTPDFPLKSSMFKLCLGHEISDIEKLVLLTCFSVHFKPTVLDRLLVGNPKTKMRYREFGGVVESSDGRFIPTLQTLVYLIAGNNDKRMLEVYEEIRDSKLFTEQILNLKGIKPGYTHPLQQIVEMDLAYFNYLVNGKRPRYDEVENFPATLLTTTKTFDDLVLKPSTIQHLQAPMNFVKFYDTLYDEDFIRKVKPGYVVMLYGPPGTGKTMTVSVLGKELGVDVYAISLSRVVSKYIGETEKNLERVFERLMDKRCILFFDEADALFGKRTEVKDAKDRYANQEVAYLLQKIEEFPGLVILASNYKQNLDDAFKRRILSSIFVPPPDEAMRYELWNKGLPNSFRYDPEELPEQLSARHPLTGASIANVIKLGCIEAISQQTTTLTNQVLEPIIQQELYKEGKNMKSNRAT